jgi:uncharacterized membrane protein (UPF0182 family)
MHNLLRWIILILLLVSVVKSYMGWKSGKAFSAGDRKIWLFTMIAAHVTLLIGLYQWLAGRYGLLTHQRPEGVSMMKDGYYRFFQFEHPLTMIVAILLITMGYGVAKKHLSDSDKYRKAFQLFLLALILILLRTPWPFMDTVGRGLFPGA